MKNLIIIFSFLTIPFVQSANAGEIVRINVNRLCSAVVGIPYASDNFSDAEWNTFKQCVQYIRSYDGVK